MRRSAIAILAAALVAAILTATAQADPSEYGIKSFAIATTTSSAGSHPDFTTSFELKKDPEGLLPSTTQKAAFELPPGLLANPEAIPKCTAAQLTTIDLNDPSNKTGCPQDSQIGVTEVTLYKGFGTATLLEPVYNMEPGRGQVARLGFIAQVYPVLVGAQLDPGREYAATAFTEGISSLVPLLSANTTLWGNPASEIHDTQRVTPYESAHFAGVPQVPGGKRASSLSPTAFMVNPTRCGVAQGVRMTATPYALPTLLAEATAPLPANVSCGSLEFQPAISIAPTTSSAETGSGLNVRLTLPQDGLNNPNLKAEAQPRRVEVSLPEGVTINPSQAEGLGACAEAALAKETATSAPGEGCPESSKIGEVTAKSPALEESAEGGLYVAKPRENPFGSLIAVYMVLKVPDRGVVVKLAGRVDLDPVTGRLVTVFDDIPQLPVSSFDLHFREGARSPLVTPGRCGTFESTASFTTWSGQTLTTHPRFEITRGASGGPCPGQTLPFKPDFKAGSINNEAGSFSPFYLSVNRHDGEQDLSRLSATLPPGLVAKFTGVSQCSGAAIDLAKTMSGEEEATRPSCPASSEVGNILAGGGVGPTLTYVKGKAYLAGPYRGAPLSMAAIVPAVAGPFDIGTVVTRLPLRVNPRTGQGSIDGVAADPLPRVLAGIPLKVRDIRVNVDRPQFTLNPTSCDRLRAKALLGGAGGDVFNPTDDSLVSLTDRFQAAGCAGLGFKPKLSLKLNGGTTRSGHPSLRGVYKPRRGDANLAGLVLRLPHSAFLDQAHIRTICTRVQFAAQKCPPGAIYGHARAFTPIFDQPLEGPVYLRSSNHSLPDLVAALHGLVDIEAVARIDSVDGGIRATFTRVPDAPLSKVVVRMQGGKKGLIVNSTDLCAAGHRAKGQLEAHNAKRLQLRPLLQSDCAGSQKRHNPKH